MPSYYSPYTNEDLVAFNRLHGHELAQNYSMPDELDTLATMVPKLEARHGLLDRSTMVSENLVPYQTRGASTADLRDVNGQTFIRGEDYPASNPYARAIYLNKKNIASDAHGKNVAEYKMSVLDHELNHAQEVASGGPSVPEGTSKDNTKRHFVQSDTPGQMFNYEGRDALKMMLDRLQRHAKGLP